VYVYCTQCYYDKAIRKNRNRIDLPDSGKAYALLKYDIQKPGQIKWPGLYYFNDYED
jgi:hypothetical protein